MKKQKYYYIENAIANQIDFLKKKQEEESNKEFSEEEEKLLKEWEICDFMNYPIPKSSKLVIAKSLKNVLNYALHTSYPDTSEYADKFIITCIIKIACKTNIIIEDGRLFYDSFLRSYKLFKLQFDIKNDKKDNGFHDLYANTYISLMQNNLK